jgi:hypothetical protein
METLTYIKQLVGKSATLEFRNPQHAALIHKVTCVDIGAALVSAGVYKRTLMGIHQIIDQSDDISREMVISWIGCAETIEEAGEVFNRYFPAKQELKSAKVSVFEYHNKLKSINLV